MSHTSTTLTRIAACAALLSMLIACDPLPPEEPNSYVPVSGAPCNPGYDLVPATPTALATCISAPPTGYIWIFDPSGTNTVIGWACVFSLVCDGGSGSF